MRGQRRSKFNALPTMVDGIKFASKKEAKRYGELLLLQKAGEIRNLEIQPKWPIVLDDDAGQPTIRIATYIGDFQYEDQRSGELVVEDVKGVKTPVYRLKKKLVEALHGIQIREV